MLGKVTKIIAMFCAFFIIAEGIAVAARKKIRVNRYERRIEKTKDVETQLSLINKYYTSRKIRSKYAWQKLGEIEQKEDLKLETRIYLIQQMALILEKNEYPILAAIYASQAITAVKNPEDKSVYIAWKILYRLSKSHALQNILEVLAENLITNPPEEPPAFGRDWNYYTALAFLSREDTKSALAHLQKLNIKQRLYMPARYQEALLYVDQNNLDKAIVTLKSIVDEDVTDNSPMEEEYKKEIRNYARLALGRVYYEKKEFFRSVRAYRNVDRESVKFYESLFEQSWAFFMAGYPNHALGGLYSMETPFFDQLFHPEAGILEAVVYYWMCRYDDSRHALADFVDKYAEAVDKLNSYMQVNEIDVKQAYELFEQIATKRYDEKRVGIPAKVLETASQKDSMYLLRDQFATLIEEKARLEKRGIFKTFDYLDKPRKYLAAVENILVKKIGKVFQAELTAISENFQKVNTQAEFLYVELLMSEKEKIMGRELHANTKINNITMRKQVKGWGGGGQNWNQSRLNEYWWDEVGYYIYNLAPTCGG